MTMIVYTVVCSECLIAMKALVTVKPNISFLCALPHNGVWQGAFFRKIRWVFSLLF